MNYKKEIHKAEKQRATIDTVISTASAAMKAGDSVAPLGPWAVGQRLQLLQPWGLHKLK